MLAVDYYAHHNRFRQIHPAEKLLLAGGCLALTLCSPQVLVSWETVGLMVLLTLAGARIPGRLYGRLLLLPLSFLLPAALTAVLRVSLSPTQSLWSFSLGTLYFGLGAAEARQALVLISRSLAAVSCLYFLSLTTPVAEILAVFRRLGVPVALLELMSIVYRSLFVLWQTAHSIYLSQSARQGYANASASRRSLGVLAVNLFTKANRYSHLSYLALLSRGYQGSLILPEVSRSLSWRNVLLIAITEVALYLVGLVAGGAGIG
ncbi:MAG: cobalt ECF transporter T component CbiQ [Moorellales bacterium]